MHDEISHEWKHDFWADRLHELQLQKARLQTRIEFAGRMARRELAERRKRLRNHAAECFERTNNDPNASILQFVQRKKLLELANREEVRPGEYWDQVREIEAE